MNEQMSTVEYWNTIYTGRSTAQPGGHETDRFAPVLANLEGPRVIDVAAGYADLCKRIRRERSDLTVVAADFADEAMHRSGFKPYVLTDATAMPFPDRAFDTVICTQAMGYMADPPAFLREARRVGWWLLLTVSDGEPAAGVRWAWTPDTLHALLEPFGELEFLSALPDLAMLVAKLRFTA